MEGPYVYSEVDAYTNQVYPEGTDLVSSVLNQSTVHVSDPGNLDTPMWLANQGAMKKWYSMTNQAWWRAYMGVLYNVVNYWQGEYLMKLTVFQHMSSSYFNSASDINTFLLINNPATTTVQDAIYNDPWYGLSNYNNYAQWSVLQSSDVSTAAVREKLAFQAELRTYFGLNSAQVQELTNNWNSLYSSQHASQNNALPSPVSYENNIGWGYWQWATGEITSTHFSHSSIESMNSNAFAGYYEMPYFISNYF